MNKIALLAFISFLLFGCANKSNVRYDTLSQSLERGGFSGTIQTIEKEKEDLYGEKSAFLYHFDLGVLFHYNRDFKKSIDHLTKAEQIYEDLYAKSVTNEAAALLTNDNTRPYRARPFELLFLYQVQILNYLAINDLDGANVEVKRAQMAMEALYQKDSEKVNDNGFLQYLTALVYEMNGENDNAAISYYKAVKAYQEYRQKLPTELVDFTSSSLQKNGREDDLRQLNIPNTETPLSQSLEEKGAEIVVVGYAGHSPILGEMRMSGTFVNGEGLNLTYTDGQTGEVKSFTMLAPIIAQSGTATAHIAFSLPEKKVLPFNVYDFSIYLNNEPEIYSESVTDLNDEITRNLKDDWSGTVAKTAARVALRTFAAQKTKKAVETSNPLLNLATSIGTDVASSQLEKADLRVGLFMPNRIHMTRIPVAPGVHDLDIAALDSRGATVSRFTFKQVSVQKGQKLFLFIPAIK